MEGKTFKAPKKQFKTTNGTPETPAGFTATISGSSAQLNWQSVQCATGFKIYKVGLLIGLNRLLIFPSTEISLGNIH